MTIPQSVRELVATGPLAHITTLGQDGSPHVTVVWLGIEGDEFVYLAAILSPGMPQQLRFVAALIPALLTAYVAWNLASGIGLFWTTSNPAASRSTRFAA